MAYTLKTNRRPTEIAREMDEGLDEVGAGGMDWKEEGDIERRRESGRKGGREGAV